MSRGHQRERAVRDWLTERDWVVVRAAGSLGGIDLVAMKVGNPPRLIEVKSTAGGPYERFGPTDRADLRTRALWAGAEAWLAWWPPRGKLHWIPSESWPPTPSLALLAPLDVEGDAAEDEDDVTAFIQDMGACVDCPHSEGCPIGTCERAAA